MASGSEGSQVPLNGSFSTGTVLSGPDVAVRNLPDAEPPAQSSDCFLCGGRTYVVTDQSVLLRYGSARLSERAKAFLHAHALPAAA